MGGGRYGGTGFSMTIRFCFGLLNRESLQVTREQHTADFIAETVTLLVGPHSGNGELVSMVTLRGGLWADSPPALATV